METSALGGQGREFFPQQKLTRAYPSPPVWLFLCSPEPGHNPLIHISLPFVMYGELGRMSGQSLIGGTDDAYHSPLWIDPFGNKAGEAAPGGFRWQEQVGSLPWGTAPSLMSFLSSG